ncbi:uncharacterized protein LOC110263499 [Arachis ipaensis]|uniref:uncharacterized protein LOC110263499 n=1 Tax=Arachis ipaensis TaxID=130454 RepID=UPI000A2B6D4E|nr:uncharacterized protein LOC110263499 [Arachis ipaensis]
MGLKGKQAIQILAVLVLISLGMADNAINKIKTGQCLGLCGDDIVSCMIDCYIKDMQHFLNCAMKCENKNNLCMGSCTNIEIPSPTHGVTPPSHKVPPSHRVPPHHRVPPSAPPSHKVPPST